MQGRLHAGNCWGMGLHEILRQLKRNPVQRLLSGDLFLRHKSDDRFFKRRSNIEANGALYMT